MLKAALLYKIISNIRKNKVGDNHVDFVSDLLITLSNKRY
jgi:hypothetical protein